MRILKRLSIFPSAAANMRQPHAKQQPFSDGKPADKLPDIRMVITDYYRRAINDIIYMIIRDVDHVMVSIVSAEDREVEKGPAMNSSGVWSYRTAVANPAYPGGMVVVTAGNLQGHQTEARVAIF
ncbi:hypothetical protein [Chitinophaga filiformis]|uniref:Uncharacterized protein n=1 Tax=Chitinophaga filiformis TaxID=104663 RepID=A0ABY4HWF8_CHIFI|nr:hypothetical protein [Chitinophaga filiformis]UPK67328.1 hypothetical protein MYF79_20520 [Chitinophaga filiformis]